MKTKEELSALKEEVETLNKKLAELNEDELKQVFGGASGCVDSLRSTQECDEFLPLFPRVPDDPEARDSMTSGGPKI